MASVARRHELEFPRTALQMAFRNDVLAGLSQERKAIPARWFYDLRGSQLFEEITALPEYYPTRAEIEILTEQGGAFAEAIGRQRAVVEFGAGSANKTPLLLDGIEASAYVPIDISGEFLRGSCATLAQRYPRLPIFPVEADFTRPVAIPGELQGHELLGFFPGSTIGNMEPRAGVDLLRGMRATLGDDGLLLIGMDLIKPRAVLAAAYDDAAGVTAAFNLNLARRINRELDGTIPVDLLRHRAVWNERRERIEMHLEAVRDISFHVCGRYFTLLAGETIHTENSHKYDERGADLLLLAGGWEPLRHFTDQAGRFMVVLARAMEKGITA
ncbi:L-histidine N(alpha)-methyltransferase [Novosphingobium album (ex Liu et al. 2023)]|uniref:L-histidine N(Alpha)-methyltransferase n=1 Tax=Novosphingobium album (ex Liu et al. 2023) TaxID=3031130 RepID=A0ABT5WRG5_9SPHN|nr:L-histidine N(alpha)-methyltransferase [Novosphingobium album (ex Liu et al. 2023)]MDE8652590.1 L-histidine N(alpha)-methyltransferase [Novosphingobium album (ex Liu et al. 2023)]